MTDLGMDTHGEFGSDGKEQIDDGMYDALDDRLGDGSGSECCTCCNSIPTVVFELYLLSLCEQRQEVSRVCFHQVFEIVC